MCKHKGDEKLKTRDSENSYPLVNNHIRHVRVISSSGTALPDSFYIEMKNILYPAQHGRQGEEDSSGTPQDQEMLHVEILYLLQHEPGSRSVR